MVSHLFSAGLLLILLFLSGCGGQKVSTSEDSGQNVVAEQKELIREHITDSEKQSKLLKIVDEIEIESGKFFTYYETHIEKVSELSLKHQASRDEFQQLIDDYNRHYEKYLLLLVNKREEMRLLTSEEDWKKIMDRETSFVPI